MYMKPALFTVALLAAGTSGQSRAATATDWDVNLDFSNTTLQSVNVSETDQDVPGFAGITSSIADNGSAVITVEASGTLDNTKDTGNWFQNQVNTGAAIGCKSSSDLPKKLRFAFIGDLTVALDNGNQLQCDDVVFGMGYTNVVYNNWWLGGPGMSSTSTGDLQQSCTYDGAARTVTFSTPDSCVNSFSVSISSD